MKTFGLVLALLMVVGVGSCLAETATFDTYTDWDMISLPLVPLDPVVDNLFTGYDMWFTGFMQRWDAPQQRYVAYDPFDVPGSFGSMLLGDGYWFNYPTTGTISYSGVADGVPDAGGTMTDMWVSLPGNQPDGQNLGGWHMIGNPFNHDIPLDPNFNLNGEGISFTDGTAVKNWDEAVQANWVDSQMLVWDPINDRYVDVGYFFNTVDKLEAWRAYWIQTKKDNLAMIIPAYPPTP